MSKRKRDTCCKILLGKIPNKSADLLQQRDTSQCLHTPTHKHTHTHTSTRKQESQEMVPIHFVGSNRTNFGSESPLMSRPLMRKTSDPRAKLIHCPHNPAQVQPCSLLHYLSCVPKSVINLYLKREKIHTYMRPCLTEKEERRKHAEECRWYWDDVVVLHLSSDCISHFYYYFYSTMQIKLNKMMIK